MTTPKRKLRDNKVFIKGQMNWFEKSREIIFKEQQNEDWAVFVYNLQKGQNGGYSEEYLPYGVSKGDKKRVDVTAIVVDDENKICHFRLYDLKTNIGAERDLEKLAEQWKCALFYMENYELNQLQDYHIDGNVGVITRRYEREWIKTQIDELEEEIQKKSRLGRNTLAGRRMQQEVIGIKARKELMSNFYCLKYMYVNRNADKIAYDFELRESECARVVLQV